MTNIFVFNFKGELILAGLSYPGLLHESKLTAVTALVFLHLSGKTPSAKAILGDSTFAVGGKHTA